MKSVLFLLFLIAQTLSAQTEFPEINKQIELGNFSVAGKLIDKKLEDENLTKEDRYALEFKRDRMHRISLDFNKTEADILPSIKKYFPQVSEEMIAQWEKEGALEHKYINGNKRYFHNAVPNLFRVNKQAKAQKEKIDGKPKSNLDTFLQKDIPSNISAVKETGKNLVNPVKMKLDYTLTVEPNAVPAGEVIRAWLPYPKENHERQTDVKLISVNDENYIVAPDTFPQRTLYMEKTAQKDEPTEFKMSLEYTAYAKWCNVTAESIKAYNKNSEMYQTYTAERAPHVVFTDEMKKLSKEIIGEETNPYNQVNLIFKWLSDNIPWASAREYSTIENISNYCIASMQGDCGIKSLLFITLCRMNGIPAKWQSGWMLHPGSVNLHDWAQVYFEGYGWIPVDPYMGIRNFESKEAQYFYTSGLDAYHFVVNDDYSRPLFPAKIYPRSETVDFQRGEVEWKGGNLYFDTWDYSMNVEYQPL